MNILDVAVQDQSFTLKDIDNGFGHKIVFISPTGIRYGDGNELIGKSNDIGLSIDPNTDTLIVGRTFEFDLSIVDIENIIGSIPTKDWKCEIVNRQNGNVYFCHPASSPEKDNTLHIAKFNLVGISTT